SNISPDRKMIVRAYAARTGKLQWEIERPGLSPVAIAARSGRVFVAGSTDVGNAFLAAVNTRNGGLIWEDSSTPGNFVDVKAVDRRVVGVGASVRGSLI